MFITEKCFRESAVVEHYGKLGLKDMDAIREEKNKLIKEVEARKGRVWRVSLVCAALSYLFVPDLILTLVFFPVFHILYIFDSWWALDNVDLVSAGLVFILVYLFISKSKVRLAGIEKGTDSYCASIGLSEDSVKAEPFGGGDTSFMLGRVQSANEETISDTHVTIGKDVFGNVSGSSYNTYSTRNTSWIYDLENKREVKYSGVGESIARPGHDIGIARYRGKAVLEYNLSTNEVYNFKAIQKEYLNIRAIVLSLGFAFFGWVLCPLFVVVAIFSKRSGVGFYVDRGVSFPGGERPQILGLIAGLCVTAGMYCGVFMSGIYLSMNLFLISLAVGLSLLFVVHKMAMKKTLDAYESYLSYCESELSRRYKNLGD